MLTSRRCSPDAVEGIRHEQAADRELNPQRIVELLKRGEDTGESDKLITLYATATGLTAVVVRAILKGRHSVEIGVDWQRGQSM